MPEVSIDQLRRTVRRWRMLALVSLAALGLTLAGWAAHSTVQVRALSGAQNQAKQAAEQAERERKAAEENLQVFHRKRDEALYANHILQAQQAWEQGKPEGKKR